MKGLRHQSGQPRGPHIRVCHWISGHRRSREDSNSLFRTSVLPSRASLIADHSEPKCRRDSRADSHDYIHGVHSPRVGAVKQARRAYLPYSRLVLAIGSRSLMVPVHVQYKSACAVTTFDSPQWKLLMFPKAFLTFALLGLSTSRAVSTSTAEAAGSTAIPGSYKYNASTPTANDPSPAELAWLESLNWDGTIIPFDALGTAYLDEPGAPLASSAGVKVHHQRLHDLLITDPNPHRRSAMSRRGSTSAST